MIFRRGLSLSNGRRDLLDVVQVEEEEGRQAEEQRQLGRGRKGNLRGKKRMGKVMKVESRHWSNHLQVSQSVSVDAPVIQNEELRVPMESLRRAQSGAREQGKGRGERALTVGLM